MKRIYYAFHELEEAECNMWRITSTLERPALVAKSVSLLASPDRFTAACSMVIDQWPRSVEYNLTNDASNRTAWMGQAACCLSAGVPEECTRLAWGKLTRKSQIEANFIADSAIEIWEYNNGYKEQQLCLNMA